MNQPDLFDDRRPVSAIPASVPPFQGSSIQSRETSRQGAAAIAPDAASLQHQMLDVYAFWGDQTDAEMATFLGLERSTVNARRWELIKAGRVDPKPKGTRKNPRTGVLNSTWGLV